MEMMVNLKTFLAKCVRVWHILRKPGMAEYKAIAKVSAIGLLIIGLLGFSISIVMHLF